MAIKNKAKPESQESRLRGYWQHKIGDDTEFKKVTRDTVASQLPSDLKSTLAQKIFEGRPLARDEFLVAVAIGYLITDLPYIEFFKSRWHETKDHMGYGPAEECGICKREKE